MTVIVEQSWQPLLLNVIKSSTLLIMMVTIMMMTLIIMMMSSPLPSLVIQPPLNLRTSADEADNSTIPPLDPASPCHCQPK